MSAVRWLPALALTILALPSAAAHGDLEVHEAETLAISDFEGAEDSFPHGGFEIWDVHVGEAYNATFDADGVYVKANFAGDGTKRLPGQREWSVEFSFDVAGTSEMRSFSHDGSAVTSDFDSFTWGIMDGNVLHFKGWVALPGAAGKSLAGLTVVSAVDGDLRDVAPGGVFVPLAGLALDAPGPLAPRGRVVEEVPLEGPGRYFTATAVDRDSNRFELAVTNSLAKQGQHVEIVPGAVAGWQVSTPDARVLNLKGGESGTLVVEIRPVAAAGSLLVPLRIDLVSDIGGRRSFSAFLDGDAVRLVPEGEPAATAAVGGLLNATPAVALAGSLAALGAALLVRRR